MIKAVKKIWMQMIGKAYRKIRTFLRIKKNPVTEDAVKQLYPFRDNERCYEEYEIKKLSAMFGMVFIGLVSVVCLRLCSQTEGRLTEGAQLIRNEWGAGDYFITLQAESAEDGWQRDISMEVEERKLTEEEKIILFQDIEKQLPELIRGKNEDLQHVESSLQLVSSIPGYPVVISWSSSSRRVNEQGEVDRAGLQTEGEWIELKAEVSYEKERRIFVFQIYLLPELLSEEENFFKTLEEELSELEKENSGLKIFSLPSEINGRRITWKEINSSNDVLVVLFIFIGAFAVMKGMDRDLLKRCGDRKKYLLSEYPDFVSRLRLYLSAGMPAKAAFYKLAEDYQSRNDVSEKYMSQELQLVCNRFQNGISEETVYQEWGKRCVEMPYRRLALLLCNHLRLGNARLLRELAMEEEKAREERMQHARKLGEEAGVKLLFPMLLELLVVLFLILVPAYMDFNAI